MKWVDREFYVLRAIGRALHTGLDRTFDAIWNWSQRYKSRRFWHAWYAWRPVSVREFTNDGVVVPRHYVWLEPVDRRRQNWFVRRYRSHTMAPGMFEAHRYSHADNRWEVSHKRREELHHSWDHPGEN